MASRKENFARQAQQRRAQRQHDRRFAQLEVDEKRVAEHAALQLVVGGETKVAAVPTGEGWDVIMLSGDRSRTSPQKSGVAAALVICAGQVASVALREERGFDSEPVDPAHTIEVLATALGEELVADLKAQLRHDLSGGTLTDIEELVFYEWFATDEEVAAMDARPQGAPVLNPHQVDSDHA